MIFLSRSFQFFLKNNPNIKSLTLQECNLNEFFVSKLYLANLQFFELIGGTCNAKTLKKIVRSLSDSLLSLRIENDCFESLQSTQFINLERFTQLQCLSFIGVDSVSVSFHLMLKSIKSENLTELRLQKQHRC